MLSLEEIIVDGTKIRAPASRKSYLRAGALDKAHQAAKDRVKALKAEIEADPAASSRRSQAAEERAARERLKKVEAAQKALEKLKAEQGGAQEDAPQGRKQEERTGGVHHRSGGAPDALRGRSGPGRI